ncbi:hypothetical protein ACFV2H_52515 [Streptomyces sp. NPDC059629]|uniref:hypothetical protein n=1 Tax=Streptomyces sp. NPDC059629 TaxID=3346889 RepID=UPI0036CA05FA
MPPPSQAWQLLDVQAQASGHGRIVAEYFDVGRSRTVPWARKPQAAALLAAMADPDRDFDTVIVGSGERAFYGNQFAPMAPLFEHYGVGMWVPELGGAIDPQIACQEEPMTVLGILSKREITRARIRVRSAMTVQTSGQGRYLGGRPPYGYRLADAGPHPHRALARRGARIQDHIMPHLPGLIIRLTKHKAVLSGPAAPPSPATAVEYLRADSTVMIFDPATRTLTAA